METDLLVAAAAEAAGSAYAPYSGYAVGAALLCSDGTLFTGCNVENGSYGLTNCAERTALFSAVAAGQRNFSAIAIFAAGAMPYPCGACRQVLGEFSDGTLPIHLSNGKTIESYRLEELLPHRFSPESDDPGR